MARQLNLDSRPHFKLVRPYSDATADDAGSRAYRLFCTPSLSSRRGPDHDTLVERARFHLRTAIQRRIDTSVGAIQTYELAPDAEPRASVLIVHGWAGEAAFMGAIAEYLRRRGFRAVMMDMPAHGLSSGTEANLIDCARAVLEVAESIGSIRFALGHSIGAMAALTAGEGRSPLPRAYPFDAYVLIAMPDRFAEVTRKFGAELGLKTAAQRAFEHRLEALAERRIVDFTGSALLAATARPTLLIHARDDQDVAFSAADSMCAATPHAELQAFDGLGHRAILYAPQVVRAAAAFIDDLTGR